MDSVTAIGDRCISVAWTKGFVLRVVVWMSWSMMTAVQFKGSVVGYVLTLYVAWMGLFRYLYISR